MEDAIRPASDRSCEGQVALVTGASAGGTGTAIAIRLAAEGAKVAITARTVEGLERTRERIEAIGGECLVLPADISDPAGGRRELVSRTEARLGPVDILVNDAHASNLKPFEESTADELAYSLQVNFIGPWELMKAVVPGMRERRRGWILNLTTLAAELPSGPPFPDFASSFFQYGSSKAALNKLTVTAAGACEGQGIAVNALSPVLFIATPRLLAAPTLPGAHQPLFEPLEAMAEAALTLCSGDPDVLTGRIAYSLQLLAELRRPVRDLHGEHLVEGWQPDDLPAMVARQVESLAERGWLNPYGLGVPVRPTASS
jgi:NAD(P)-dependent dehydrogenase (short-subunit alcohol dehydrogenase family)